MLYKIICQTKHSEIVTLLKVKKIAAIPKTSPKSLPYLKLLL